MESKYDDEEKKSGGVEDTPRRASRARRTKDSSFDFTDCAYDAKHGNYKEDNCVTSDAEVS